jgi:hypothetical protein
VKKCSPQDKEDIRSPAKSGFRAEPRDALVFANNLPGAAVYADGPVLRLGDFREAVDNPQRGRTIIDELPATVNLFAHLTFAVAGTGAWTVEKPFGAPRERAYADEFAEAAGAAAGAFFGPDPLRLQNAYELGIEPGVNGGLGKPFGKGLNTCPASERADGVIVLHPKGKSIDECVFALAFNGALVYGHLPPPHEPERHPEGGTENARLTLPARQTDGDAGTAPDKKHPLVLLDHVPNFRNAFSIGDDHDVSP